MAHIFALNRAPGGVPKTTVFDADLFKRGMEGDRQRNKEHHGGIPKALCLFSLEVILKLQAEGHSIYPGSTGENLTISGIDWSTVRPGMRMKIGDVAEIEITLDAVPCKLIGLSFMDGEFTRIAIKKHPTETRWYAKVLTEGRVKIGDEVVVTDPGPEPEE